MPERLWSLSRRDAASRLLLLSQAGPHAARAFTVYQTSTKLTLPSPSFASVPDRPAAPLATAPVYASRCMVSTSRQEVTPKKTTTKEKKKKTCKTPLKRSI